MATLRPNGSTSTSTSTTTKSASPSSTSTSTSTAPTPTPHDAKSAAIKARIIKHMNSEHADSLVLYLRFYKHISFPSSPSAKASAAAASVKLVDMTYSSLVIECEQQEPKVADADAGAGERGGDGTGKRAYTIPIIPSMLAWSDVRERVVAMDREARKGLGLPPPLPSGEHDSSSSSASRTPPTFTSSSSTSTSTNSKLSPVPASAQSPQQTLHRPIPPYTPPTRPTHLLMVLLVVWFSSTYALLQTGSLRPGTWYWDNVMTWFPALWGPGTGGSQGYKWLNEALWWPVVGLHVVEAGGMVVRLRGRRGGMGLWWAWVGSTLLEGWGVHQRFGEGVRRVDGGAEERRRRRGS